MPDSLPRLHGLRRGRWLYVSGHARGTQQIVKNNRKSENTGNSLPPTHEAGVATCSLVSHYLEAEPWLGHPLGQGPWDKAGRPPSQTRNSETLAPTATRHGRQWTDRLQRERQTWPRRPPRPRGASQQSPRPGERPQGQQPQPRGWAFENRQKGGSEGGRRGDLQCVNVMTLNRWTHKHLGASACHRSRGPVAVVGIATLLPGGFCSNADRSLLSGSFHDNSPHDKP